MAPTIARRFSEEVLEKRRSQTGASWRWSSSLRLRRRVGLRFRPSASLDQALASLVTGRHGNMLALLRRECMDQGNDPGRPGAVQLDTIGMSFYTYCVRPALFLLNAERAHRLSVETCRLAGYMPGVPSLARTFMELTDPALQVDVAGLTFKHPIGLAAGWDKNARAVRMLDHVGFSFFEIGSVSAQPSIGNPKPRLFRLPHDRGIIVNYGVPNDGADVIARRLAAYRPHLPLGVNLVKTNLGPGAAPCSRDEILADYERSASLVHRHASYLSLNLSCPNAADGKNFFSQPGTISQLLERLEPLGLTCPVILKVAPVDDPGEHERLLLECEPFDFVRGFCFNLPSGKPDQLQLKTRREVWERLPGAVSGKPVEKLINRCIAGLAARLDRRRYAIIGAGGVFSAEDAYEKIRLGASLIQLYTALIYEGPGVVKRILRGLVELLRRDGFNKASDAVGTGIGENRR